MGGACGKNGGKRNAYCVETDKPKAQKPLGRTKIKRQDIIKMYLKEMS
jgi:hypothetical protein